MERSRPISGASRPVVSNGKDWRLIKRLERSPPVPECRGREKRRAQVRKIIEDRSEFCRANHACVGPARNLVLQAFQYRSL
jgi:hypothetical protein